MLWVATLVNPKQESASSLTNRMTALRATLESGLVQEGYMMTPTLVETRQLTHQIMKTNTSKPWDTSWCSDKKHNKLSKKASRVKWKYVDVV